jgi:hypothetical protein
VEKKTGFIFSTTTKFRKESFIGVRKTTVVIRPSGLDSGNKGSQIVHPVQREVARFFRPPDK